MRGSRLPIRHRRSPGRPAALLSILFLAAIIAGCGRQPVVLTGTITDAYTAQPVPEARVTIGNTTVTTDANGAFSTSRWRRGDVLAVSAPGYEPLRLLLAERPELAASDALTLTLNTVLRPNTLSGTVTDAYTGQPLANAQVTATFNVTSALSVATGADGRYLLSDLPEEFTLSVVAPDYAPVERTLRRTTSLDLALRPSVLTGTITDRYTGQAVAGAAITAGTARATSGPDGHYRLEGIPATATSVEISADGYAPLAQELSRSTVLDAALRPDTLRGRLIDKNTGKPLANAAILATTAYPGVAVAFERIADSSDGSFTLKGVPEQGYLHVLAPGYRTVVLPIKPGAVPAEIALERFRVKALYVTAAVASSPALLEEYLQLIDRTELNAIVIDLKSDLRDDLGIVYYDTQVPLARELGLSRPYIDMPALVRRLKDMGIYTIARIQLFSHDNALSDARPEWSVRLKETGEVYADYPGPGIRYAYLDPTNRNVWDYNIQLGVEAALMGFDEINYDYIRFPDWFGERAEFRDKLLFSEPIDPVDNPERMFKVITEFMDEAHRAVNGAGAKMSIDIFGRVVLGGSLTIAQDIRLMGDHTDYICPMPYPSLWWPGAFDLPSPVDEPFKVLDAANAEALRQIEGEYARLRPWLQDHTDPWAYKVVRYGPAEVRAQIEATEKYPEIDGWMLYDSANAYKGAFGGAVKPER
ncbi:MAG: putative glycoside hydrolase [Oscillochloridaceae bacterium]|nr:carboxypeptidase regulatory-like domain-containing protein [Chloroflexaceae bacterium]MDW8390065.1 putative glycoside hydrolase [Oscillochloridaceae bacterium]